MTTVTTEMITELCKSRDRGRAILEQAKGRLGEINKQMDEVRAQLAAQGLTPETAPAKIEELQGVLSDLYTSAMELKTAIDTTIAENGGIR